MLVQQWRNNMLDIMRARARDAPRKLARRNWQRPFKHWQNIDPCRPRDRYSPRRTVGDLESFCHRESIRLPIKRISTCPESAPSRVQLASRRDPNSTIKTSSTDHGSLFPFSTHPHDSAQHACRDATLRPS
jgi:hypothetical protein